MTLVEQMDNALRRFDQAIEEGYPKEVANPMRRILEIWRSTVISGHYDEKDRHDYAGAAYRIISEYGRAREHPFTEELLDIAERYVRNDV